VVADPAGSSPAKLVYPVAQAMQLPDPLAYELTGHVAEQVVSGPELRCPTRLLVVPAQFVHTAADTYWFTAQRAGSHTLLTHRAEVQSVFPTQAKLYPRVAVIVTAETAAL